MWQELGLLSVLALPAFIIIFARSFAPDTSSTSTESTTSSSKKKNKKKSRKGKKQNESSRQEEKPPQQQQQQQQQPQPQPPVVPEEPQKQTRRQRQKQKKKETTPTSSASVPAPAPATPPSPVSPPAQATTPEREVDEHMDPTPKYARVMRIAPPPEDDDWEAVPREKGWTSIEKKPARSTSSSSIPGPPEPLTKNQRKQMARTAKRKEEKAAFDAEQAARLRQHQRELERIRIEEYYTKGAGKNTSLGKKSQHGSAKTPTAKAGLNEHGQLIWD